MDQGRLFNTRCGKAPLYWIKDDVPEPSSLRARTAFRLTKIGIFPAAAQEGPLSYI
jgi:hypothetical protein